MHSLDPALLCLWCSPAATVLIQPLAWEPPCAVGVALKREKKKDKKKNQKTETPLLKGVHNIPCAPGPSQKN